MRTGPNICKYSCHTFNYTCGHPESIKVTITCLKFRYRNIHMSRCAHMKSAVSCLPCRTRACFRAAAMAENLQTYLHHVRLHLPPASRRQRRWSGGCGGDGHGGQVMWWRWNTVLVTAWCQKISLNTTTGCFWCRRQTKTA